MAVDLVVREAWERNRKIFDGPFGAAYGFYMQRELLSRLIGRVVWGSDLRPYYASMAAVGEARDGATIVDCPCGAGVALRAMRSGQQLRYLGFDISPAMVERARERAAALGLEQPTFAQGNAEQLPLEKASVDLFLSYFGLHCLDEPQAAVSEAARCLRPGGRLIGSAIVRGSRRLDRLRVRPGVGGFGRVGDEADLREWLAIAGLASAEIDMSGVFAVFTATKSTRH